MNRQERIKKLEEVSMILKTEFVGLDSIIDDILRNIEPWYITPEVIKRPTIISLWGMTGTGKTSVVKRLIELLELSDKSVYFDCGAEADNSNRNNDIVENICRRVGLEPDEISSSTTDAEDIILMFDEFQYAKTLGGDGEEFTKSNLRNIWKLIDDGLVELNSSADWEYQKFLEFIDDLEPFAKNNYNMNVKAGYITDPKDVKKILDEVGYFIYPHRKNPTYEGEIKDGEPTHGYYEDYYRNCEGDENIKDPYDPLRVISIPNLKALFKKISAKGDSIADVLTDLTSTETLGELIDKVRKYSRGISNRKKILKCNKSLIFIIGNLDEAFYPSKNLSADIDADVFRDITSRVTISDIKNALLSRYRPEQVARIGNNLIKYPTLGKQDFEKIIHKEVERILGDFNKEVDKITIKVSEDMYQLLYEEGVYPTQGVRPIFTTIGSILTPFLSKILIDKEKDEEVVLGIKDPSKGFKVPQTIVTLKFGSGKETEYPLSLQLGPLRNPENCKTRYANAVHEAGHAIVFALLTGEAPINIVAVSSEGGGFCTTYLPEKEGEISNRRDIDVDVMVSLAGYLAEEEIFDNPEMRLMGSYSDLNTSWFTFSQNVMLSGYFDPICRSSHETENIEGGRISGLDLRLENMEVKMKSRWDELKEETRQMLIVEKRLIKKLALILGERGSIRKEDFIDYVEKYGEKLSKDYMEKIKETYSSGYYLKQLEE